MNLPAPHLRRGLHRIMDEVRRTSGSIKKTTPRGLCRRQARHANGTVRRDFFENCKKNKELGKGIEMNDNVLRD
jgi:hypothetical protein